MHVAAKLGKNEEMKIKTLNRPTIQALDIEVNQLLDQGWELHGQPWHIINEDYKPTFFQQLKIKTTKGRNIETK